MIELALIISNSRHVILRQQLMLLSDLQCRSQQSSSKMKQKGDKIYRVYVYEYQIIYHKHVPLADTVGGRNNNDMGMLPSFETLLDVVEVSVLPAATDMMIIT